MLFFSATTRRPEIIQPCNPSPCGINADCIARGNAASCKCINDYTGNPYIECKPECVVNGECPRHLACVSQKCKDPCPGICGVNAKCYVTNHLPVCKCDPGYTGDAFVACQRITTCKFKIFSQMFQLGLISKYLVPPRISTERVDPCSPSPCGENAQCTTRGNAASCKCIRDYFGDPYVACRPECTTSAECPANKACQNFKCVDPCPGLCGVNAQCRVINHVATCTCNTGYVGDPFRSCQLRPSSEYFDGLVNS